MKVASKNNTQIYNCRKGNKKRVEALHLSDKILVVGILRHKAIIIPIP